MSSDSHIQVEKGGTAVDTIKIVLPERIFILKSRKGQVVTYDREEYSIYYKNIIYPYSVDYDIQIECPYGKNLGDCWRLDSFDTDTDAFGMTVRIYDGNGVLLAEKGCEVELIDKKRHRKINLMCIGDSMTRSAKYIAQAAEKVHNIKTIGLRNMEFNVNHEGRGGWSSYNYFKKVEDTGSGVSPFLFPKGYSGKEYFGSRKFWERVADPEYTNNYQYSGFEPQKIEEGMVAYSDGALYRYSKGEYELVDSEPEFEFSFAKYIERYITEKPDIVSILFGANEFQICRYSEFDTEVKKYIAALKDMVSSIREYDKDTKIIINMPICGGSQYAWGTTLGCTGSAKQYDLNIKRACEAILDEFDGRSDENIFVCPMLAVCDTESGFPWDIKKANIYSEMRKNQCANWVHPSEVGYRQMGDALSAVIMAAIR